MSLDHHMDYTKQGRRPSAKQIVADWKKAGRPLMFSVEYGETFAEFERINGRWHDSGNGCEGVKREKVVSALTEVERGNSSTKTVSRV